MANLVKIDPTHVDSLIDKRNAFISAVKKSVADCQSKIPADVETLDTPTLTNLQSSVKDLADRILAKNKDLKEERMELTRKLDDVKKFFTSIEKSAEDEVAPLSVYVSNVAKELLRRHRAEEAKIEAARRAKEYEANLKINIDKHFTSLLKSNFVDYFNKLESKIYGMDIEALNSVPGKLAEIRGGAKAMIERLVQRNPFALQINNENTASILYDCFKSYETGLYRELEAFYEKSIVDLELLSRSRKAQLEQGLVDANADSEALKDKHEKALETVSNEVEKKAKESALNAVIDVVSDTQAANDVNIEKIKVKLKYEPKTHSELLEIVKMYISEKFGSEPLPTLLNRLSFMVTYANSELSNGKVIDGVTTVEDVKVK